MKNPGNAGDIEAMSDGPAPGALPDPNEMLDAAEKDGTLKPLADLMTEKGWPVDAKTFMVLAQKDDRTKGKPVEELVGLLQADDGEMLYQDIAGRAPGGAVDRAYSSVERRLGVRPGAKKEAPAEKESPAEDAAEPADAEAKEGEPKMNMFEKMKAMKAGK